MCNQRLYDRDLSETEANRVRLQHNPNLLHWYWKLYSSIFGDAAELKSKTILEIGSGASPLQMFYPSVITSDVLRLEYVTHVFDCHEIDKYAGIDNNSVDIITLTNVLHHLRDPLLFLRKAAVKLKPSGRVVMVEPFFSLVSYPIYRLLHHEPVDFSMTKPGLDHVEGPLSTSNQAVPHMIFFSRPAWRAQLADCYDLDATLIRFYSSISYMLTGGISRRIPIPPGLYKTLCAIDCRMTSIAPKLFASFFIVTLEVKRTR